MSLLLRDSWQEAWETAAALAVEALDRADLEERSAGAGARWLPGEQAIELSLVGQVHRVHLPGFEVCGLDGKAAPPTTRILLLHYLQRASGAPLAGEWTSFADMPGGDLYLGKFRARSVDRLVRAFAGREQELVGAAAALGGRRVGFGDAAVEIPALPRVPVSVVLWAGDDEFPATGNLLFDAAVAGYLALEDMVVLAGMVASRLCGPSQGGGR